MAPAKKSRGVLRQSARLRYAFIRAESAEWPVRALCYLFDVHPSGYYAWLNKPRSKRAIANERLTGLRPLDRPDPGLERVAKANGFSLHAGVSCEGHQKEKVRAGKARETALGHKRERLCRYIARPAAAVPRLSLSSTGKVLYTLKWQRR